MSVHILEPSLRVDTEATPNNDTSDQATQKCILHKRRRRRARLRAQEEEHEGGEHDGEVERQGGGFGTVRPRVEPREEKDGEGEDCGVIRDGV